MLRGIQYIIKITTQKKPSVKQKRQHVEWEKIFANAISGERLIYKIYIYKNLYNATPKKQSN